MQLTKIQKEMDAKTAAEVSVCVLNTDIISGQVITEDLLSVKQVNGSTVPANALGTEASNLNTYTLQDINGNPINTIAGQLALSIDGYNRAIKE